MRRLLVSIMAAMATVALLVLVQPAQAARAGRAAVTLRASTLGLGVDLSLRMTPRWNLRLTGRDYSYDYDDTIDDVDYEFDFDLGSYAALLDFHPTRGSFHVTAGLVSNDNEFGTRALLVPSNSYDIGNSTFTGAELGDLTGVVEFDSSARYLGIGWGNPFTKRRPFGFAFDLGVLDQGAPDVTLRSSNPGNDPAIPRELLVEELEIEDDLDGFELYPVVSLGFWLRF